MEKIGERRQTQYYLGILLDNQGYDVLYVTNL